MEKFTISVGSVATEFETIYSELNSDKLTRSLSIQLNFEERTKMFFLRSKPKVIIYLNCFNKWEHPTEIPLTLSEYQTILTRLCNFFYEKGYEVILK
jgi:hypothetical protein